MDGSTLFSTGQWVGLIGSLVVSSVSLVVFSYSTFHLKREAEKEYRHIEEWLVRIENKIDRLIEHGRK